MREQKTLEAVPQRNFLSLKQAQEHFGISRSFLYQLQRQGKLQFLFLGAKPFVKPADIEQLMSLTSTREAVTNG